MNTRVLRSLLAFLLLGGALECAFFGLSWVFQGYGLHPLISGAFCALLVIAGYFTMPESE